MSSPACPVYAPLFGVLGIASALAFSSFGAAIGTMRSGLAICDVMSQTDKVTLGSAVVPIVMAGVVAIYGLVVGVLMANAIFASFAYSLFAGFVHMASGITVGLCSLAAGIAIGVVGDAGVRGTKMHSRAFVPMILILIFSEVLGLYGLIMAIVLNGKASSSACTTA